MVQQKAAALASLVAFRYTIPRYLFAIVGLSTICLISLISSTTKQGWWLGRDKEARLKEYMPLPGNASVFGRGIVHSFIELPEGAPADRKDRFPSFTERLKMHMGNWYLPPCNITEDVAHYRYFEDEGKPFVEIMKAGRRKTFDTDIAFDRVMWYDWSDYDNSTEELFTFYLRDMWRYIRPWWIEFNAKEKAEPPIIVQFGDQRKVATKFKPYAAFPIVTKVRLVASPSQSNLTINETDSCLKSQKDVKSMGSVVHFMEVSRHRADVFRINAKDVIPWEEKIPQGVLRASTTGHPFSSVEEGETFLKEYASESGVGMTKLTKEQHDLAVLLMRRQRVQFCFRYRASKLFDLGMIPVAAEETDILQRMKLLGERMDLYELLKYKVIIVLEGNDVATSLKWALYSHSVVLMTKPTVISFAMEEFLEPWVHYVPLQDDLSDAEEKMQWILNHDEKTHIIAERGRLFIHDFLLHPDAEAENQRLQKEILRRVRMHFRPMP